MTNTNWMLTGFGAAAAALLAAGCASPFDDEQYHMWRQGEPPQWQLTSDAATHDLTTVHSRLADAGRNHGAAAVDAAEAEGVEQYVLAALQRNPAILAAQRRVERMGVRVPQVTSLDDPMFQVAPFGEMAQTAAGEVGLMTGVSQKLPFPGKLDTRGRIARQDVAMAVAELEQTRLRVAADTRQAYWSYYFTTRALQTTQESRSLLSNLRQIAETEYKAGTRSQTDVLRAAVELSNLDNELITLSQRQATARSMLNQLMDRPVNAELPPPQVAEPAHVVAALEDLLATAAQHNPGIAKVRERIEQFRHRHKLARLSRWPDVTLSATYNAVDDDGLAVMANGDDQWWLGFGINLPIWVDKYNAAEREAVLGMLEGVADLTAEQNRIAFQVQDAYLKAQAQRQLIELFRDVILPQARQTVEASSSGYRAGSVDFLTLVDNWRKLLNFELMYHRALADMEQAVAELERAIGQQVGRAASNADEVTHE